MSMPGASDAYRYLGSPDPGQSGDTFARVPFSLPCFLLRIPGMPSLSFGKILPVLQGLIGDTAFFHDVILFPVFHGIIWLSSLALITY